MRFARSAPALGLLVGHDHDVVTWVPASAARRRRNGFDHGEVLARAVGASSGSRVVDCSGGPIPLRSGRPGGRRRGRDRPGAVVPNGSPDRGSSPAARRGARRRRVLVVDDVRTTGASLRSAAAVAAGERGRTGRRRDARRDPRAFAMAILYHSLDQQAAERGPVVQIRVSARHVAISEHDRGVIAEKIDRLGKYLPGMERAEVHFSEERNPRIAEKEVCEVTLEGHGHHVRCKSHGPDVMTSVDRAIGKLENKLHRLKTKLARKPKHKTNGAKWPTRRTARPHRGPRAGAGGRGRDPDGGPRRDGRRLPDREDEEGREADAEPRTTPPSAWSWWATASTSSPTRPPGRAAVVYRRDDGDIGLIDEAG